MTSKMKEIGAATGVPPEMLEMTFSTSFSSSRAAMNMATANFRVLRDWFVYDFCQPIYEEFITNLVAKGYIDLPDYFINPLIKKSYTTAKWSGPADLQIDPL
jgi:capsid protein